MKSLILLIILSLPSYAEDKTVCEKARDKAQDKCFKDIDKRDRRELFPRCIDPFWNICKPKKVLRYAENEQ